MVSILAAVAGLVGLALAYKLVTARPNPRFNLQPGPYPDPHPNQDKLVELLIADATGTDTDGLANFVRKQRWGGTELRKPSNLCSKQYTTNCRAGRVQTSRPNGSSHDLGISYMGCVVS
jgi:hypothetical protein